jgi:hypothetical protein
MGDRKGVFDPDDGREGDCNHTIGTFPGSGIGVVRGGLDGDGHYTELSEFVSLSRTSRMTRGIIVNRTTEDQALALGNGTKLARTPFPNLFWQRC